MELHSALHALAACDLAENVHVFALIEKNISLPQSEYRIYCAWLLRERYGQVASSYLLRLLTDDETRVHRFTLQLFEKRKVEAELVRLILDRIAQPDRTRPWHLRNLLRILGTSNQFSTSTLFFLRSHQVNTTATVGEFSIF